VNKAGIYITQIAEPLYPNVPNCSAFLLLKLHQLKHSQYS